jgi:hypothetical protein
MGIRCKNLQTINSIEIFYSVTKNKYIVEYSFHKIDFEIWLEIYKSHIEDVEEHTLYDNNVIIKSPLDIHKYYFYTIISSDVNLYNNIYSIPFIYDEKYVNINLSTSKNTWNNISMLKNVPYNK